MAEMELREFIPFRFRVVLHDGAGGGQWAARRVQRGIGAGGEQGEVADLWT